MSLRRVEEQCDKKAMSLVLYCVNVMTNEPRDANRYYEGMQNATKQMQTKSKLRIEGRGLLEAKRQRKASIKSYQDAPRRPTTPP